MLFGFSCSKQTNTLDFKTFTIEVPKTWDAIQEKGTDSYVGRIAIDNNDTLFFDLGWYSNSLGEEKPYIIENDRVLIINEHKSTATNSFYEYYGRADTTDLEKFLKNKISCQKIDNKNAKIVRPKRSGIGITGVYIDSLWVAGCGIDRFCLSGNNLKPKNERILLEALKTIKFFQKK